MAKLIFLHGFSDHIGRYYGLFPTLAGRGVAVYGLDQRGWGRSVTKQAEWGLTGPTTRVIADIVAFARPHLAQDDGVPVFVMGHSMGGGEVLTLMCSAAHDADVLSRVRGWVLESPFIGWPKGEQPSWIKVVVGRLAAKVLPHVHLVHRIAPEKLSHDAAVVQSLRDDKLLYDTGTLEGLAGLLDRTEALRSGAAQLGPAVRSVWVGHGTLDYVTSYDESRAWFDRQAGLADKTFRTYDGWFHQLHTEPEKELFYNDVVDWILARCGPEEAVVAADAAAAGPAEAKDDGEVKEEGESKAEADAAAPVAPEEAEAAAGAKL